MQVAGLQVPPVDVPTLEDTYARLLIEFDCVSTLDAAASTCKMHQITSELSDLLSNLQCHKEMLGKKMVHWERIADASGKLPMHVQRVKTQDRNSFGVKMKMSWSKGQVRIGSRFCTATSAHRVAKVARCVLKRNTSLNVLYMDRITARRFGHMTTEVFKSHSMEKETVPIVQWLDRWVNDHNGKNRPLKRGHSDFNQPMVAQQQQQTKRQRPTVAPPRHARHEPQESDNSYNAAVVRSMSAHSKDVIHSRPTMCHAMTTIEEMVTGKFQPAGIGRVRPSSSLEDFDFSSPGSGRPTAVPDAMEMMSPLFIEPIDFNAVQKTDEAESETVRNVLDSFLESSRT